MQDVNLSNEEKERKIKAIQDRAVREQQMLEQLGQRMAEDQRTIQPPATHYRKARLKAG